MWLTTGTYCRHVTEQIQQKMWPAISFCQNDFRKCPCPKDIARTFLNPFQCTIWNICLKNILGDIFLGVVLQHPCQYVLFCTSRHHHKIFWAGFQTPSWVTIDYIYFHYHGTLCSTNIQSTAMMREYNQSKSTPRSIITLKMAKVARKNKTANQNWHSFNWMKIILKLMLSNYSGPWDLIIGFKEKFIEDMMNLP